MHSGMSATHAFAVAVGIVLCLVNTGQCQGCAEPDELSAVIGRAFYELYTDPRYGNFSLNIVPCLREQLDMSYQSSRVDLFQKMFTTYKQEQGRVAGDNSDSPGCSLPHQGGSVTSENSFTTSRPTCNWNYEIDYDELRLPKRLAKAVCACRHCHRGSCRPVNSYIPALRKSCDVRTGRYIYRMSIEEVPVGCACVKATQAAEGRRHPRPSFKMELR